MVYDTRISRCIFNIVERHIKDFGKLYHVQQAVDISEKKTKQYTELEQALLPFYKEGLDI